MTSGGGTRLRGTFDIAGQVIINRSAWYSALVQPQDHQDVVLRFRMRSQVTIPQIAA